VTVGPVSPRIQSVLDAVAPVGTVIANKFLVERVLGAGGMGVVVAAMHLELDQRVALKFLLPEALKDQSVPERFAREARAAAKIRSEHVVRVLDVGRFDNGAPFMVMEYLEGRDLGDVVETSGALPVSYAVDVLLQACEALAEAHAAGIVHRDLKPSNLFLAENPDGTESVKLLDFGISKSTSSAGEKENHAITKTTDVFGSPQYMSPEHLVSARDVDHRTDIWALGAILYELCTAQAAFAGNTFAEIAGRILHTEPPRPCTLRVGVPPGLDAAIMRCLSKDVNARYADISELVAALAEFGTQSSQESLGRVARVMGKSGPRSRAALQSSPSLNITPGVDVVGSVHATLQSARDSASGLGPDGHGGAVSEPRIGVGTATAWGDQPTGGRNSNRSLKVLTIAAITFGFVAAPLTLWLLREPDQDAAVAGDPRPDDNKPSEGQAVLDESPEQEPRVAPVPAAEVSASSTPGASSAPSTDSVDGAPTADSSSATANPTSALSPPVKPPASKPPQAKPPPAKPPRPKPPPKSSGDEFGGRI